MKLPAFRSCGTSRKALICFEKRTWPLLVDLYSRADGVVFCSPEMQEWTATEIPEVKTRNHALVLDGDLPKEDWLNGDTTPRLSATRAGRHTLSPGRPIGLHPETVAELSNSDIHLHFYGDFKHGQWNERIARVREIAPDHLHLHGQVDQCGWVKEFSQYDARVAALPSQQE
jgi:hypothetical protein